MLFISSRRRHTRWPRDWSSDVCSSDLYHYDHSVDLGAFLFGRMIGTYIDTADKNLNVYGPKDKDIIKQVKNTKFNKFHAYDKDSAIKVGPFTVTFHKNTHPVETYAMKITDDEGRVLVYTADTSYRKSLVKFAEDADALITECRVKSIIMCNKNYSTDMQLLIM